MESPPGPKPPGSPGDCRALAAVCDAYASSLQDEVHAAGKVHGLVGSEIWTGRAARYVNNAVSDWQAVARPAAEAVRGLATLLRGAADDLTREQADWQRRVDRYDAAVRDLSRWGRT